MVRHFVGLQSLVYTIHKAYKEIGLILIIFTVTVIMFAALGEKHSLHFKTFSFKLIFCQSSLLKESWIRMLTGRFTTAFGKFKFKYTI